MTARQPRPYTETEERIGNVVIKLMSRTNTLVYKKTGGKVGSKFVGGAPLCLLTTVGNKSGTPRTTPLIYAEDEDNIVVVASKGGFEHHPHWYLNIRAEPFVEIQIGDVVARYHARDATSDERERLWPRLVDVYADFEQYRERAEREIPVVICEPATGV